jgi:hypothetical protein
MYEKGWGKDLHYILAFTVDSVVDVTRRYTRKFKTSEFQGRRKSVCPAGEFTSEMIISQFSSGLQKSQMLPRKQLEELDRRLRMERIFLENTEKLMSWDATDYSEGRQSGCLSWRISRGETKSNSSEHSKQPLVNQEKGLTTNTVTLNADDFHRLTKLKLRMEDGVVPSKAVSRLPDSAMPLASQLIASLEVKQSAFMVYVQSQDYRSSHTSSAIIGFCTKPGLPVYLIDQSCYPFVQHSTFIDNELSTWKTFHFVPNSLTSEEDKSDDCNFDLPINREFFNELLGAHLVRYENGQLNNVDTMATLSKCRLVAFYFSAHW